MIKKIDPDFIHITTEGPLGWAARKFCLKYDLNFTTAYHTMFPEYVNIKYHLPLSWGYHIVRKFHAPSSRVMVATMALEHQLMENDFPPKFGRWSRGVDLDLFHPKHRDPMFSEPFALYVGRVSHEKNIQAFLTAETPDLTKIVVGDGPQLPSLKAKYKDVVFTGAKKGEDLAKFYANADVFVFPSKTDTFGLVMIEAMASGTPVAAYNEPNTTSIVVPGTGACHDDLNVAISQALTMSRLNCRQTAETLYSWDIATDQFLSNLVLVTRFQ